MEKETIDIAETLARLSALTIFELRGEWRRLHRAPPPMRLSRDLLVRGITYKLQERSLGGLSSSILRKLEGLEPAIYVSWDDAKAYVAWLSRMTGKTYRLLTGAEWEGAARAGTKTAYYWGNEIGKNNANCDGCGSQWDNKQTAPVGSFKSNAFGLYDMAGNVWQWVEDCYHDDYDGAPTNGSEWLASDCNNHVVRGGGWGSDPQLLRSANRLRDTASDRYDGLGFRVGRTLTARAGVITVAPGAH
jgi:formylglycine-generating enzyme required for sulfatase activity